MRSATIRKIIFVMVFVLTVATSLAAAWWTDFRELATISLFLPLIWAFLIFRPPWMIVCGAILAAARIADETIQQFVKTGRWELSMGIDESLFPVALYIALGVVLYTYRGRQSLLMANLIESGTQEARNRLAGSLAHDFNNILTVVIGTVELLLRDRTLSPAQRKDLDTIHSAGEQGLSLVSQMRLASRTSPGEFTREDLSDLVERQMQLIERMLPHNIHVVRSTSGALPVRVDKGQILRVLMNFCLNARDAMAEGGVLTVRTSRRDERGTPFAELTVSDTGSGIDPNVMDRVFDPFFTMHSDKGCVGLGLTIVRSIATGHHGHVEVRNIPGAGASFSFLIPIDVSGRPPASAAASGSGPQTAGTAKAAAPEV